MSVLSSRVRRQRGQVLMLCLALLFAGALGVYLLFGAGQAFATRQRLNNAADAAAYSAAAWQARVLNYQAYANRAIVAQEVAIAQAVTLVSWARYFETFTGSAAALSAGYPPVSSVLTVSRHLAGVAARQAEQAAAEEVVARSNDTQWLAASQEILQRAMGTFAAGAVANEVARANDPRFFAFAMPGEGALPSRRYEGAERARLRGVVVDSLDDFTRGPRALDLTLYPLPSLCFGNLAAGTETWFQEIHKRGGTVMAPDLERWEAADTHSLHTYVPVRGVFGVFRGCRRVEALPLGGGAGEVGDPPLQSLQADPGEVRFNPGATGIAEAGLAIEPLPGMAAYPGIAVARDLDYPRLSDPRFPTLRVSVLARTGEATARTAHALNLGVGRLRLIDGFAASRLWSLASAEVYFRRPPSGRDRLEYASLYSPYWQVRLVEPSTAERALAQTYVR